MNHDPITGTFWQIQRDWEAEQTLRYGSVLIESEDLCLTCGEPLESDESLECIDCLDSQS